MNLVFDGTMPRLTERSVEDFERRHGPIPSLFRDHLLAHNGGSPRPCGFAFVHGKTQNKDEVQAFYGVGEGVYGLAWVLEVRGDRIPSDLFPIATTPGGDLVLIGRDDSARAGGIFYWSHEEDADEGEAPDARNVYPIAESFEAFLSSLVE